MVNTNRKVTRAVTRLSLEKFALYYLGRYSSSSSNLRDVLFRRVMRSKKHVKFDIAESKLWIEQIIYKLLATNVLDDKKYADMYSYSLRKVGKSDFMIRKKLKEKGISEESIRECIIRLERDSEISELAAAIITAKRKRLGPYRKTKNGKKSREKDLAVMARHGFDYKTTLIVLDT